MQLCNLCMGMLDSAMSQVSPNAILHVAGGTELSWRDSRQPLLLRRNPKIPGGPV